MVAETTPTHNMYSKTTSDESPKLGSYPMILTVIIVVAAIGYLNNIITMDSSWGGVSHMIRALGAVCPPLGAVLGYM